jgi:hypothetical protein
LAHGPFHHLQHQQSRLDVFHTEPLWSLLSPSFTLRNPCNYRGAPLANLGHSPFPYGQLVSNSVSPSAYSQTSEHRHGDIAFCLPQWL